MEFEIDEFALETWILENEQSDGANHAPGWFGDCGSADQTGVWIPEEAAGVVARAPALVG